ncbi:hypothetical protein Taro_035184, partial [Colocasia esculenta]|nr:hypothetical protein [Colocasia esculenta]
MGTTARTRMGMRKYKSDQNHWQLIVICNKRDNDMSFLMLLDSLHMGEPTRIKNELKKYLVDYFKRPIHPPSGLINWATSEASSDESESDVDSEIEEAMLSRRLQLILAKKKKFQSGRRHLKRNKDFKKPDGKDLKKGEPICYECKKPGHIKVECPKFKKPELKKKESSKKFRKYKKKTMAAAWENSSDSDSESNSCSDEEEAHLAFMANTEDK